jgi:glycosyltransferase involved in cell wall biosynthesis
MQTITTIGLDIAKSVFQVHGVDGTRDILKAHSKVDVHRFVRANPDSLDLSKIAVFNQCWKEARGNADYVIIVDCDEHIFHPKLIEYLAAQKRNEVTLIPTLGFQKARASASASPLPRRPLRYFR